MLANLQPYTFSLYNLNNLNLNLRSDLNKVQPLKIKNKITKNNSIELDNKLFWCLYIFLFGEEDYNQLQNTYKIEQKFKFDSIFKIRDNKELIKFNKIKQNLVEDDLINSSNINIKTLNCLALIYKLNIIYIKNNTYFQMNYNLDENIEDCKNIIEDKDNNISIINNTTSDLIKYVYDNYYLIENINKPIKAISAYRVNDLIEISKKLKIDNYHNKLKKDLYNEIISFF